MKLRLAVALALLACAAPALADKLVFDYRMVPALKAVLDSGDPAMISYDNSNPRNVVDLIAIEGKSARDWHQALVIIARKPDRKIASPADWKAQLEADAARQCPAQFAVLASDANSVTFERRSTGCRAGYPAVALYRVVQGQQSLFLLAAMSKDDFTPQRRGEWLAMMGSAHLE